MEDFDPITEEQVAYLIDMFDSGELELLVEEAMTELELRKARRNPDYKARCEYEQIAHAVPWSRSTDTSCQN
jgi:hypothetical protein